MAHSDYSQRGAGVVTPSAVLGSVGNPGDTVLPIASYTSDASAVPPALGTPVMIHGEIMKLVSFAFDSITVERGCADTVPHVIPSGSKVWFLDSPLRMGTDSREYTATGTIGVKVLMRTTGAQMDVINAPAIPLTFNLRFARPYPPAQVRANGSPWHAQINNLDVSSQTLTLSWVGRNRITQADQLLGHQAGNVTPEPGTTYVVRVFDATGALQRTVAVTGNEWVYSMSDAASDLDVAGVGHTTGHIELRSVRDGLESFQAYRIDFQLVLESVGWGFDWGDNWGGDA